MKVAVTFIAAAVMAVGESAAQQTKDGPAGPPATRPSSGVAATARYTEAGLNAGFKRFPVRILPEGTVPLHVQILLDRAGFSPGIIDGAWGANAARALSYFAAPEGGGGKTTPAPVSAITAEMYQRLKAAAGPATAVKRYKVTAADLSGPFVEIPENVYRQAKLRCLCYSSPAEAIAERFHISARLLAQLNPRARLDRLAPGTTLLVPNVDNEAEASASDTMVVARLVVSRTGFWTQAQDESGRVIFHFPSTLGGGFDPSPIGNLKVVSVSESPAFRYQPALFAEVPDSEPQALLPPGPNSPVGRVWIGLSKKHYGIHGTSSPETIGYATSHGCVRLTNWDALQLALLVEYGTPVVFR
ncbi:MAG: L,D-transpeptidase family protein [Gemmatimonadaceae bacterium]|nr:L,D-transpeptidase family protein [Gemmatimonadaceae bacterium]MDQ3244447.1 L,D-transpeptidase family protein [Gemmatimonadota bacterium]